MRLPRFPPLSSSGSLCRFPCPNQSAAFCTAAKKRQGLALRSSITERKEGEKKKACRLLQSGGRHCNNNKRLAEGRSRGNAGDAGPLPPVAQVASTRQPTHRRAVGAAHRLTRHRDRGLRQATTTVRMPTDRDGRVDASRRGCRKTRSFVSASAVSTTTTRLAASWVCCGRSGNRSQGAVVVAGVDRIR